MSKDKKAAVQGIVNQVRQLLATEPNEKIANMFYMSLAICRADCNMNTRQGRDAHAGFELLEEDLKSKPASVAADALRDAFKLTVAEGDDKMIVEFCQSVCKGLLISGKKN